MLTVAVDFDGTLCKRAWPAIGDVWPGAMDFLRWLEDEGHARILWTCREGRALQDALGWLAARGFPRDWWHAVNGNTPGLLAAFGTDPRKVGAGVFVDDNAIGFPSFFDGAPAWDAIKHHIHDRALALRG